MIDRKHTFDFNLQEIFLIKNALIRERSACLDMIKNNYSIAREESIEIVKKYDKLIDIFSKIHVQETAEEEPQHYQVPIKIRRSENDPFRTETLELFLKPSEYEKALEIIKNNPNIELI